MPLRQNNIVIAAAGSGKTTHIVKETLQSEERVAIVTYTQNNESEIKKKFQRENGVVPDRATVVTWFSFLLADWIRPYGNFTYEPRVEGIIFVNGRSTPGVSKSKMKYFIGPGHRVYTDKISEFALICNSKSNERVVSRLTNIYQHIYIDEVQDLAGYDLELLELLFHSQICVTLVGDPRQATYKTNHSPKNSQYGGAEVVDKFEEWETNGLCRIDHRSLSHRCIQSICKIADSIYPNAPETISHNSTTSEHDGLFFVRKCDVHDYISKYQPAILRQDKRTKTHGYSALNFGASKGLTFRNVLIYPSGPLKKMLKSGNTSHLSRTSAAKIYVAITRAEHSVVFVYDGMSEISVIQRWYP